MMKINEDRGFCELYNMLHVDHFHQRQISFFYELKIKDLAELSSELQCHGAFMIREEKRKFADVFFFFFIAWK